MVQRNYKFNFLLWHQVKAIKQSHDPLSLCINKANEFSKASSVIIIFLTLYTKLTDEEK